MCVLYNENDIINVLFNENVCVMTWNGLNNEENNEIMALWQ
jgi:hypothetical protein